MKRNVPLALSLTAGGLVLFVAASALTGWVPLGFIVALPWWTLAARQVTD